MSTSQCVVIGGGVAGSCAALALARRGVETTLLDAGAFPRHKVCGEFFSPESRAVLRRLGVEELLLQNGARAVQTARIVTARRTLEMELPGAALAISRYRMDALLWRAAQEAGVLCLDHARVKALARTGDGWTAESNGQSHFTPSVILATGRTALTPAPARPVRRTQRYFGLKAHFRGVRLEPGVVELHPWRGGYCGLVRVEGDLTNICLLARYENWDAVARRAPAAFWQWLLNQSPALRARMRGAERVTEWLATGNVSFGRQQPECAGALHCGDAAGYIHPLTGDGMAMAARSGELAATVVAARTRGSLNRSDAAALYAAAWQREFGARLRWATRLEPLLTNPRLTTPAMTLLALRPALARPLVTRTRTA
jgi:flavin-dependent dehydrogenase